MKHLILIACLLLFTTTFLLAQKKNKGKSNILLTTDFDGEVSQGSIKKLIEEIRQGTPIRVGWKVDFDGDGKGDLEHWIDANFISILNGHVFNQIDAIYQQVPKFKISQVTILHSPMKWAGIIGTNGKLLHRYIFPHIDKMEDDESWHKIQKRTEVKQTMVATMWAKKK